MLVPKLLLENEIVFQALLGQAPVLSLTLILAKQSLAGKRVPKQELGNQD